METNYSYKTSLPAYRGNKEEKQAQATKVLRAITVGKNCLLQVAEYLNLPQSTIAGRVNDLIEEGRVCYCGFTFYKNRKRKRIAVLHGNN